MEDEPIFEVGQEVEHTIPIKRHEGGKRHFRLAGVVVNKPFVHFTTKQMHISDVDDHQKLHDPDYYVSIFFTNEDPCKKDYV